MIVLHVRSCHPRGWSGAGVGVGMVRGKGEFLVYWFLGFLVSWLLVAWFRRFWFLCNLFSWCLGFFVFVVSWLLGFLVSMILGVVVPKFFSFLVSKCLGFRNSRLLGLEASKIQKITQSAWKTLVPYYQTTISCYLVDIDPISKIFKHLLNGSGGISRCPSFPTFSRIRISMILELIKMIFSENAFGFFLRFVEVSCFLQR